MNGSLPLSAVSPRTVLAALLAGCFSKLCETRPFAAKSPCRVRPAQRQITFRHLYGFDSIRSNECYYLFVTCVAYEQRIWRGNSKLCLKESEVPRFRLHSMQRASARGRMLASQHASEEEAKGYLPQLTAATNRLAV